MKRILFAALLSASWTVYAASAVLTWTPPTDKTGIAGYQVRYGTRPGDRSNVLDVPGSAASTVTISTLDNGTMYYFAVRSANASKTLFSSESNEVSAAAALAAPSGLKVSISITTE